MLKHLPIRKLILSCGDVLLIIASFYLSYAIRQGEFVNVLSRYTGATIISLFVFLFLFYVADVYHLEGKFYKINNILRIAVTITIANCLIAVAFYFLHPWRYSRVVFLLNSIFIFSFMVSWRFIFEIVFKYREKPARILIVGAGSAGRSLYECMEGNNNYKIVGFLDDDEKKREMAIGSSTVIGDINNILSIVRERAVDGVVVAITHGLSPEIFEKVLSVRSSGVEIYDMPRFYEKVTGKIPVLHISDSWLACAEFYGLRKNVYNTKIKKGLDKIVAVLGIIASFPLILVAIIAIKIESKGSVFFKQKRVGENAIIFEILKLRTMKSSKEYSGAVEGFDNEMMITRVGKMLRFFRIDEIPQLWNVIKGDMSIVGPRSLIKEEVDFFAKKVPYFLLRYSVKPGVTGWAQVNYKHGKKIEDATEKLQYDLYYIKNHSPILDLHIFIKTTKVMLFGKGAR
jgi:exopolysaccharide biosynthesis polyprenyl glycosylphosphotransferase